MKGVTTEIRQQLRNQTLGDLQTGTIQTVGDRIYPDELAVIDLDALNQIVSSWRSTHVQSYGNVLPNSGVLAEGIADGGGLEPSNNEVIDVLAISCANGGGSAPIEFELRFGDLPIFGAATIPNGTTKSSDFGAIFPLTLSKGNALKFVVTSGTSGDFSAKIAYQYRCK
jgi:hypothetical protein